MVTARRAALQLAAEVVGGLGLEDLVVGLALHAQKLEGNSSGKVGASGKVSARHTTNLAGGPTTTPRTHVGVVRLGDALPRVLVVARPAAIARARE